MAKIGSEQWKKNVGNAGKGRKISKEGRENISNGKMGCKNPNWKRGQRKSCGYFYILTKDHPGANGVGYVAQHRLVMEAHIGRYLAKEERIHHKNGIKCDNRLENLQLLTGIGENTAIHNSERFKKVVEKGGDDETKTL